MGASGCYVLHAYCDDPRHVAWRDKHHPGEFNGRVFGDAVKEARAAGWLVNTRKRNADHTVKAVCPLHHPRVKPDPREVAEAAAAQAIADTLLDK
jgi:hypothetical protein